jgi:hypothetical protein
LQEVSFQKLTQFSQRNNVLDAPASNPDGFLSTDTYVLSLSWIGILETKCPFLHHERYDSQEVFLSKLSQFSHENNLLDAPASKMDGYL